MAMRRRIKVGVNLTAAKRKPKTEPNESASQEVEDKVIPEAIKAEATQIESPESLLKDQDAQLPKVVPKTEPHTEAQSDDTAFKYPPKVEFNRSNSYTTHSFDDLNQTEIDDGAQVMQMDLQRSANGFPMSPKTQQRQRIKPTPIFGQRRNSLVGLPSPSPVSIDSDASEQSAVSQRRERHYSGSQSHVPTHNHITSRGPGHSTGRIRTESTCSVFSDSHMSTTSKSRKVDEHSANRSHTRRDFEARFLNGVPEKSSLKMFDLIYYNPATNPMEQKPKIEQIKTESKEEDRSTELEVKNNDNSAVPVPQLKLNAKGELILDDKSLEIETTAEQEARKVLAKSSLIYLDENTGMNGFYKRQKRTRDWPADETIRFYRCLKTIGTDFSMMCQLFPKRTRRDLKLKFKKEERCNGALINKALLHPNSFNIQELKDQFETEDRQREEEERTKNAQKSIQYRKINIKTSKSARALKNADDIYNHELRDLETKKDKRQRKLKNLNKKETAESEPKENPKGKRQPRKAKAGKMQSPELDVEPVKSELLYKTETQAKGTSNTESSYIYDNPQIHVNESMIAQDQPSSEEVEYTELLPVDENEYNHTNQYDYMDNYNEAQEYEFLDEQDTGHSRTFVNMDNGNVTLIKDTQTLYTNVDEQNVRLINNSELADADVATSSNMPANEVSSMAIANATEILYPNVITQYSAVKESIVMTEEIENSATTPPTTKTSYTINDEAEIMKILEDIANGSLVVVSTFNPASPNELINEIYMLDQSTGELCEEPLDLPQEIIQSILSVMT